MQKLYIYPKNLCPNLTLTEGEIYLKFVSSISMNASIIIPNIKERVCPLCVFAYSIKGLWNQNE